MAMRALLGKLSLIGIRAAEPEAIPRFAALAQSVRSRLASDVRLSSPGIICRAGVRATEQATTSKALAVGQSVRSHLASDVRLSSPGIICRTGVRATEQATISKAKAVGSNVRSCLASNVGLSFASNAAAAGNFTASRLQAARFFKATSCGTIGSSWASRLYFIRGFSTTTKGAADRPPRGLRSAFGAWAAAAGLMSTWYFISRGPNEEDFIVVRLDDKWVEFKETKDCAVEDGFPESIDWSLCFGFPSVISVHYQIHCSSCWAVAAVKSIEAVYFIKTGKTINLSVQQLVDCGYNYKYGPDKRYQGCLGGLLHIAYEYITEAGLTAEAVYPCSLWQGRCRLGDKPIVVRINGFDVIKATERDFIAALQTSPIAVYIRSNRFFDYFKGGRVIEMKDCPPTSFGTSLHCVLLVGYGTDENGGKYWKIQNTHGKSWGDGGYAKLRRGGSDPAGVACITSFVGYAPNGVRDA